MDLPDLWMRSDDWQSYEAYALAALTRRFPSSRVSGNIRIVGAKSGVSRQVDILVEKPERIAVDCKCYRRKVDVKHVEAFLGMLDDLGIHFGILVTNRGYTKAALKRAENDQRSIDLQILSPARLSEYQHVGAPLIWRGTLGVFLECPKGWTTDSELSGGPGLWLVAMYPLGHTLESAMRLADFIYANILLMNEEERTIDRWAAKHEADIAADDLDATFAYSDESVTDESGIERRALLRIASYKGLGGCREHCLYVDYGGHVLFLVGQSRPEKADEMNDLLMQVAKTSFALKVKDKRTK